MPDKETESGTIELRKYPNRRYYDPSRSRHVTLEEINQLIRDGRDVRVTDSRTGQDITARVLAQIIIELDPPKLSAFPVSMLHRLLRSNEQLVQDFVEQYFSQPLMAFLDSQRGFEQYMRQMMGVQQAPGMADWARMMFGLAPSAPPARSQEEDGELRTIVSELRDQVASLQQQLAGKTAPPSRKRAARRRRRR
jgi:polyhydroxyalkanoate synthesis repressor PhaR